MEHELPPLGYSYDALEPHIDAKTMEIHYGKHHAGYVSKLNTALEGHDGLKEKSVSELISDLEGLPEEIRNAIRNNGGGHFNHSLFWQLMAPNGGQESCLNSALYNAIEDEFGDFEEFRKQFSEAAIKHFGSGWCWLIIDDGRLTILSTVNQDNPVMFGKIPILGIDLWEHAYYLKHQNRRVEYIESWWNVVNWKKACELFDDARE